MSATVSILIKIPHTLHEPVQNYLETHPDWDEDRLLAAAVSLFLLQNGDDDRRVSRVYLDTIFQQN
jgi:hypothetical protein